MRLNSFPVTASRLAMPGVCLLELEAPQVAEAVRPGQFVMVTCDSDETLLPRPFSVFGVTRDRQRLQLLLAIKGKGSRWLAERNPGDKVKVLGPLGNGFSIKDDWRNLLLVAGGLGIAPLAFLAADQAGRRQVTLAAGAATESSLLPRELLPDGIVYCVTTDDGSAGIKCLVTSLALEYSSRADAVFGCGPLAMLRSMSDAGWLSNRPTQVSMEVRMGCGTGLCFGCSVQTEDGMKRVCRDGPVFPLDRVNWDSVRC